MNFWDILKSKFKSTKDPKDTDLFKALKDFSSSDKGQSVSIPNAQSWAARTGHKGVESSFAIKSIRYITDKDKNGNPKDTGHLFIKFRNGDKEYEHQNVPKDLISDFIAADSKGQFWKNNFYKNSKYSI